MYTVKDNRILWILLLAITVLAIAMNILKFGSPRYLPYIVTCQGQQQRNNLTVDTIPSNHNISLENIMWIRRFGWSSPIVVEKYKLVFMAVAKNGCTQWKKLFQRIQNIDSTDIHDPAKNKLKYLMYRNDTEIRRMLLDPSWTKATMVREPRSRLLSGYFQFKGGKFIETMLNRTGVTFEDFVYHVKHYPYSNEHWEPQARFPAWMYQKQILWGKMENMQEFGKQLLTKIGAWDEWGHKWGKDQNETLFSEYRKRMESNSIWKLQKYYNRALEDQVFQIFRRDFEVFNYSKSYISST